MDQVEFDDLVMKAAKQNFDRDVRMKLMPNIKFEETPEKVYILKRLVIF